METIPYTDCGGGYTNLYIYKIHGPAPPPHTHTAGRPQTYHTTPISLSVLTGQRVVGRMNAKVLGALKVI